MNSTTTTTVASSATSHYRFKPWNVGRLIIWTLFAVMLIVAPMLFRSSLALTMLSQIGYLIIICLSYNILLGQGGMLSFGHAVYTGLGSFIAIHAMNMATKGSVHIPLVFIPLVGGLAGAFFAILLGFVTTKKSGTTFAMITLGIGGIGLPGGGKGGSIGIGGSIMCCAATGKGSSIISKQIATTIRHRTIRHRKTVLFVFISLPPSLWYRT